jgi:hypothetical protein
VTELQVGRAYPAQLAVQNLEVALAALLRDMECLPPFSQQRAEMREDAATLRALIRKRKEQT